MTDFAYLTFTRAFWVNSSDAFGNVRYGLETASGDRSTCWLADSVDEAQKKAVALGKQYSVPAALFDTEARKADRAARQLFAKQVAAEQRKLADEQRHRVDVVCGRIKEEPKRTTTAELIFDESVCAIPCIGGLITPLPLSSETQARYPENVRLQVTAAAAAAYSGWVVVEHAGKGVAMTINEAYERGLREAPNWVPDLTPVAAE